MKLPESLLHEMHQLFVKYKAEDTAFDSYFSENRKSIKLLVDSAMEQLIEPMFGEKPRNANHARRIINGGAGAVVVGDGVAEVVGSLAGLLADYRILDTKDYLEYEEKIGAFVSGPLAFFCSAISRCEAVASQPHADRLAAVLRDIGNVRHR